MPLLEVSDLSLSFGSKILYQSSSFTLENCEKIGLVGQNGTGKTTLMSVLINKISPDSGKIKWQQGISYGYLDQHALINEELTIYEYLETAFIGLFELEKKLNKIYEFEELDEKTLNRASNYQNILLNKGFYDIKTNLMKTATGLGITSFGIDEKLNRLSGGQKVKVILAKLLLEQPDVLLLDEPTNFLDSAHVVWLSEYLRNFEGSLFLISHEFDFLDNVVDSILEIDSSKLTKYKGNISKFLVLKNIRKDQYLKDYNRQQKEIKRLEEFVSKNIARASTSKRAKSRQKQLDKIERINPPKNAIKPTFKFVSESVGYNKALTLKDLSIGYDKNKPLFNEINLEILPGEKTIITGFNGIGKSTLIKTLVGQIPALSGSFFFEKNVKIAYFEQELKWPDSEQTPLEFIRNNFPLILEKNIRRMLASVALTSKCVMSPIKTLSGGEQSKLKLCSLMLERSNFLILDEPTNHLDNEAKEVLKSEIINYEGNCILVSHETGFTNGIKSRVIDIKEYRKKI